MGLCSSSPSSYGRRRYEDESCKQISFWKQSSFVIQKGNVCVEGETQNPGSYCCVFPVRKARAEVLPPQPAATFWPSSSPEDTSLLPWALTAALKTLSLLPAWENRLPSAEQ